MTGKELWAEYQHYTRDITEYGRKLGFAGAAICWIFKNVDLTFPLMIYLALFFFVAFFMADIFQGVSAAITLRYFTEYHEKKLWETTGSINGNIDKPRWVDWPAFTFFAVKIVCLMVGFAFIGVYIVMKLVC